MLAPQGRKHCAPTNQYTLTGLGFIPPRRGAHRSAPTIALARAGGLRLYSPTLEGVGFYGETLPANQVFPRGNARIDHPG